MNYFKHPYDCQTSQLRRPFHSLIDHDFVFHLDLDGFLIIHPNDYPPVYDATTSFFSPDCSFYDEKIYRGIRQQ